MSKNSKEVVIIILIVIAIVSAAIILMKILSYLFPASRKYFMPFYLLLITSYIIVSLLKDIPKDRVEIYNVFARGFYSFKKQPIKAYLILIIQLIIALILLAIAIHLMFYS